MKGSYILLINLENEQEIQIGKLGKIFFKKGYYAYVGSALNGLSQRIKRHLSSDKKFHWHIDYLLKFGKVECAFYKENKLREECNISKKFEKFKSIPNFGSSDCKCKSHLFYGLRDEFIAMIDSLNMILFH